MKKSIKLIAFLACIAMMFSAVCAMMTSAADYTAPTGVTGASSVVTETIYIDGQDTGIRYTQMKLAKGSLYAPSSAGVVNVIEIADPTSARFQVINNGTYNWSSSTVGSAAIAYNNSHENSTVIAATNASPWLMGTSDYDADHVKSTGPSVKIGGKGIPMGFVMIDGEIWNTGWFSDENKMDNTYYTDWTVSGQKAFFVLNDGTYKIEAVPSITFKITNTSTSNTATADAVNRTPAPNSLLIYNKRVYDHSLAYADAYEIYLECDTSEIRVGETITGKVTAVYENKSVTYTNDDWKEERPAIGENTIVLSARGASISELANIGAVVGDTVTLNCAARSATARKATQIIGGFFTLVENGVKTGEPNNNNQYPTSIVGIKADGTAMLINVTTQNDGAYQGARGKNLPDLCVELGCVDAFMFDGGGSATCVTLEENAYVRRNGCSDGAPRAVGNSLAIVYDGAYVNASYSNSSGIKLLDGVANNNTSSTPGETPPVVEPDEPDVPDEPETPTSQLMFTADPIGNYRYYAKVTDINGTATDLIGYRDATVGVSERRTPAVTTGISVDANNCIAISGMAQVNGGQYGYYWSIDKSNWYSFAIGEYGSATSEFVSEAQASIAQVSSQGIEANGAFINLTADLSAYAGQTINVYFAVTSKSVKEGPCHFLTIENVAVPTPHTCTPGADATCTTAQTCTECGKEITPALGHDEVAHEAQSATCTEIGWNAYVTCSRCDYTTYEEIPSTGHTAGEAVIENNVDPDCVNNGSYDTVVYCTVCSSEISKDTTTVPATGHTEVIDAKVDATCTETGLTEGKHCSACEAILIAQEVIDAFGHSYGTVITAPTCTEGGYTTYTCSACGDTYTADQIEALGHTAGADATCTTAQTCTVCGTELAAALGHNYEAVITAPTCTEAGYTTYTCTRCSDTYTDTPVDKLGHTEETISAVPATCTEPGWDTYVICTVCDYTTYAEIPATGHDTETIAAIDATCTQSGATMGEKCKTCGAVTVSVTEIPATGHTEESIPAVNATCTDSGSTEGKKCSICGEVTVAQTEVAPLGHKFDDDNDAECNACGYTREITTDVPTDTPTEAPTETPTESDINNNDSSTGEEKGGCGSSIGIGLIGITTALAAGYVFSKKRR